MSLLKFENVKKEYPTGVIALDTVNLTVEPGDFVFLVGHSGAGKSTLVKLLIREILPSSGDIKIDGQSIVELSKDMLPTLRRKVGVVFQDFKVLNSKTVFENVAIALEVVDTPWHEIKEVVPNVLALVGLADKAERFPDQLSGGELQRLSIARALAHEPLLLVADEPTGMIDPKASEEVMQILEKINDLGTTIIMATHDQAIVDKMKKRVLRLEKGRLSSDKQGGKYHA
ncbi:MAG: cell division ATP-binding protein FtsE [Patescibacteria group bacterium]